MFNPIEWFSGFISGLRQYDAPPNRPIAPGPLHKSAYRIELPSVSKPWIGIVWHHSWSKDNPACDDWAGIKRYHMSYRIDGVIVSQEEFERRKMSNLGKSFEKPWRDIGYHGGFERSSGELVWRWGRPWNISGAHAGVHGNDFYNENYLGLCVIGNFDPAPPDPETWSACLDVTRFIISCYGMKKENILGHREVYDQLGLQRQKSCPGLSWDMDKFRGCL